MTALNLILIVFVVLAIMAGLSWAIRTQHRDVRRARAGSRAFRSGRRARRPDRLTGPL